MMFAVKNTLQSLLCDSIHRNITLDTALYFECCSSLQSHISYRREIQEMLNTWVLPTNIIEHLHTGKIIGNMIL